MKRHVITISGNIASGKSEVGSLLAKRLNYELYKASDEFRKKARECNMTLVEFNEYLQNAPELDIYVDNCTKQYVEGRENIIVDARLGFYMTKGAFNVYLKADIDMAALRLYKVSVMRGKEEEYASIEEAKDGIIRREQAEKKRYYDRYGVDISSPSNYNYIIDTTNIPITQVVDDILKEYIKWLED